LDEGLDSLDGRHYLLGGAAGAGKSTSGNEVALALGVACVSADSVWYGLQAVTSRESHPAFHYFEPTEEEWRQGPDFLCGRHIECAHALTPALTAFLDREQKEGHALLFEGAWITPDFAAQRGAPAVFIHEADESEVLASMVARSGRDTPSERQLRLSAMAWRYGNWLRDGARSHGLPVVPARPRSSLIDRIVSALELQLEGTREHVA
jgi:2-phosphoglycerate kinase